MGKFIDLTGNRYGHVSVISLSEGKSKSGGYRWFCKCDCGNTFTTTSASLRYGSTQSCGCERKKHLYNNPPHKTHGMSQSRLYHIWQGMKNRCYGPSHNRFMSYGGRGIAVCEEWKNDFLSFKKWAYANGYDETAERGKCTIDRIDVNGNYEPSNCRFVDMRVQRANQRRNSHANYQRNYT